MTAKMVTKPSNDIVENEIYDKGFKEGYEKAKADIIAKQVWISVNEELPEERFCDDGWVEPSVYVLVYTDYGGYYVSRYWGHRTTKKIGSYIPDWMDLDEHVSDCVVAWMHIPWMLS